MPLAKIAVRTGHSEDVLIGLSEAEGAGIERFGAFGQPRVAPGFGLGRIIGDGVLVDQRSVVPQYRLADMDGHRVWFESFAFRSTEQVQAGPP